MGIRTVLGRFMDRGIGGKSGGEYKMTDEEVRQKIAAAQAGTRSYDKLKDSRAFSIENIFPDSRSLLDEVHFKEALKGVLESRGDVNVGSIEQRIKIIDLRLDELRQVQGYVNDIHKEYIEQARSGKWIPEYILNDVSYLKESVGNMVAEKEEQQMAFQREGLRYHAADAVEEATRIARGGE